jgi:hypothetical protein
MMNQDVLSSGAISISNPASRKPLHGGNRSADIRREADSKKACRSCKWGSADPTDPSKGQCVAMRTQMGAIWKRYISEYGAMTCDHFAAGEVDFREHV